MPEAGQEEVPAGSPPLHDPLDAHYTMVLKAIVDGRVVPFLGAGVNLWGRSRPQNPGGVVRIFPVVVNCPPI